MTKSLFEQISSLGTEQINPHTTTIDTLSTHELLETINNEDQNVALAVRNEIPHIGIAVDAIVHAFQSGGRLIYVGAGTSGRLGVLDAAECPPTFGVPPTMVQGIIAGGTAAIFAAQEGAEDNSIAGANAIAERNVGPCDVVCGISASGRTPFVLGALKEARLRGAFTILVTTNDRSQVTQFGLETHCIIAPVVGPEIIAGSTRLKSGTAQKLVLNMLTTAAMIRIGKTYRNIMVDVQPLSDKLRERAKGIIMRLACVDYKTATTYFEQAHGNVKVALVMATIQCDQLYAQNLLMQAHGSVYGAFRLHNSKVQQSSCSLSNK